MKYIEPPQATIPSCPPTGGTMFPEDSYYAKTALSLLGNTANTCKGDTVPKQKGKNPMRYDNVTVAPSINIDAPAPQTEEAKQRTYLLERLNKAAYTKKQIDLRKVFHLDGPNYPQTYKQLIDAIKNDEYTLDEKMTKEIDEDFAAYDAGEDRWFDWGMSAGIKWTKFPSPDYKGHRKACEDVDNKVTGVRDAIMIQSPADGLAALKEFEAWMPSKDAKAN